MEPHVQDAMRKTCNYHEMGFKLTMLQEGHLEVLVNPFNVDETSETNGVETGQDSGVFEK